MTIGSTIAFVLYLLVMVGGFIWVTFFPAAPYMILAEFITIGAAAYWGKRLLQRASRYGTNSPPTETTTEEKED